MAMRQRGYWDRGASEAKHRDGARRRPRKLLETERQNPAKICSEGIPEVADVRQETSETLRSVVVLPGAPFVS